MTVMQENINPIGRKDYLSQQHIERYKFARAYLTRGQRVLDIACGSGYGSAILTAYGCFVVGADYDLKTVNQSRSTWGLKNLVNANALHLPFENGIFDAIISFETIEHLAEVNTFLEEVFRLLKTRGVFICSTPNIAYTSHPAYHLHEFAPHEFYDLIGQPFLLVRRYAQYYRHIDRYRDLLRWRVMRPMVKGIGALGLKETSEISPDRKNASLGLQAEQFKSTQTIDELENTARSKDGEYRVVDYKGDELLRIMVALATKG